MLTTLANCSPTAVPAATPSLGIHRVWVMPSLRRLGIGSLLLDTALNKAIYGLNAEAVLRMHSESKDKAVAFSQPTEAGRRLAERWIRAAGNDESARLLVFREE